MAEYMVRCVCVNKYDDITFAAFKGSTTDKAVADAKKFADMRQKADPSLQINFMLYSSSWVYMSSSSSSSVVEMLASVEKVEESFDSPHTHELTNRGGS